MEERAKQKTYTQSCRIVDRLDFHWRVEHTVMSLLLLFTGPAIEFLPIECSYENGPIENAQLLILALCLILSLKARIDKKFYIFMALFCAVLMLRETGCGRTIFFAIEGRPNHFWQWKEIPYGYLAHPIFGVFIGGVALYFFLSKSHMVLWRYLSQAKLDFWTWLLCLISFGVWMSGEITEVFAPEELGETGIYLALATLIVYHAFNPEHSGLPA